MGKKPTYRELEQRISYLEDELILARQADVISDLEYESIGNLHHEMRTPMHAILAYSRSGLNKVAKVDRKKILHYFSQINKSGVRLMSLLNNLLDIHELENGKNQYKMKETDLHAVVVGEIETLQWLLNEKIQTIEIVRSSKREKIFCSREKICRLIHNLLTNAIRYTPVDKRIVIVFKSSTLPFEFGQQKGALTVLIKDEGIGIPEKELEFIFKKFAQSSRTKTGAGGSGLGLAICQEIVNAHKGMLWAENNTDGGSTFGFSLPHKQV